MSEDTGDSGSTYEWSHGENEFILDSFEMVEGFSVDVSVSSSSTTTDTEGGGDGGETQTNTPSDLTVTSHDLPDLIEFEESGTTVTFFAETRMGLFPVEIDYLQTHEEATRETIYGWGELPPSSKEIVRYKAPSITERIFTITLTATGTGGSESRTVLIKIRFNYDVGRDTLRHQLDLRRFTPLVPVQ